MPLIFLFLLMLCHGGESGAQIALEVAKSTGAYSISINGTLWLQSDDLSFFCDGIWHVAPRQSNEQKLLTAPRASKLVLSSSENVSGKDELGTYQATRLHWKATNTPMATEFRTYNDQPFVRLVASFPNGANDTACQPYQHADNANSHPNENVTVGRSPLFSFPSFRTDTDPNSDLGWLTFFGHQISGRNWNRGLSTLQTQGWMNGPVVLFKASAAGEALVVAPFDQP